VPLAVPVAVPLVGLEVQEEVEYLEARECPPPHKYENFQKRA